MLKPIITSLEDVAEELRPFYTAGEDGRHYLQVEQAEGFSLENVLGLKSSLAKERENARSLQARLAAFDGLEASQAKDALKKVGEMSDWTPGDKAREQLDMASKSMQAKHKAELEKVTAEMESLKGSLRNNLIRASATQALQKQGGNIDLLLPHVEAQMQMKRDDQGQWKAAIIDQNGIPRMSMKPGSIDDMDIDELIGTMRETETYSPAFAGSGATGIGSSGSATTGSSSAQQGRTHRLTWQDAKDPNKYKAAKAAAENAGSDLHIEDYQSES
jgi:hypothetical protein